jgi:hypothetical protein
MASNGREGSGGFAGAVIGRTLANRRTVANQKTRGVLLQLGGGACKSNYSSTPTTDSACNGGS